MKSQLRKRLLGFGLSASLCILPACANLGPTGGHRGQFTAGTITSLSPSTVMAGGPPFTLTVHGSNFSPGNYDVLLWNGVQQIPAVGVGQSAGDTTQASYVINASLIENPGNISIVLIVPSPPNLYSHVGVNLTIGGQQVAVAIYVDSSGGGFAVGGIPDLSTPTLAELKNSGVSANVVKAMMTPKSAPPRRGSHESVTKEST